MPACRKLPALRGSTTSKLGVWIPAKVLLAELSRFTQYAGVAPAVEEGLRAQVARRKEVEAALKRLKAEQRYIEKALAL